MSKSKIQSLLISHLLKHGQIELLLPDGVTVEIGITQEDQNGDIVKKDDYCWVITSRDERAVNIDSYNLGVKFEDIDSVFVYDDRFIDQNGKAKRRLDVV